MIVHVGSIDCNKETLETLDKTIGKELNIGLKRIYGKMHYFEFVCGR